jgi:hypothetical protein
MKKEIKLSIDSSIIQEIMFRIKRSEVRHKRDLPIRKICSYLKIKLELKTLGIL